MQADVSGQLDRHELAHRLHEDIAAVLTGTMLVALGITLYSDTMLLTGGTTGLALLLHYSTGLEFGSVFLVLNLPSYVLAWMRMGWKLTLRTFLAVLLVSALSKMTPSWISLDHVHPMYGAIIGGALMGIGLLILFRHRASLGGINILALYLQERYRLRAGYIQLGLDTAILLCSLTVLEYDKFALSLAGAAVLNLILATNHRPGRYVGVS